MKDTVIQAITILTEAIVEVVDKRRQLLLALIPPAVGSTITLSMWPVVGQSNAGQWTLVAASVVFYALFAVSCHRIILLGRNSLPNEYGVYWSLRETRFAGWLIVIFVIYAAVSTPLSLVYLMLPRDVYSLQMYWYLTVFVTTYFEGRISMVLPATAVDQRMDLPNSWNLTRGHGLAIAIALFVPALVMDMIQIVVVQMIFADAYYLGKVVDSVLVFPLVAVAVGVLSVTYRKVTHQE